MRLRSTWALPRRTFSREADDAPDFQWLLKMTSGRPFTLILVSSIGRARSSGCIRNSSTGNFDNVTQTIEGDAFSDWPFIRPSARW